MALPSDAVPVLPSGEAALLASGCVMPAHPLALDSSRRLDERRQRALTRYYAAAGAGGVAVGVHTTQFEIRDVGLLEPVLSLAASTLDSCLEPSRPFLRIAGACGPTAQAVAEASLAASLGYHAVLLAPLRDVSESELLSRAAAVGEVLPVIGFYLQEAVGGRYLSESFWRSFASLPSVVAVKLAPFDRYRTVEAIAGISSSDRSESVTVYTGNDDAIVTDLLQPFASGRRIVGGLLGQWAVWTCAAVQLLSLAQSTSASDREAALEWAAPLTEANAAIFDVRNAFAGCIPGVHEVLRRQGLLAGTWCLSPSEVLSPGQAALIETVSERYPFLTDDAFVEEHRDDWLV